MGLMECGPTSPDDKTPCEGLEMPILFGVTSAGVMVPIRVDANGLIDIQSKGWIASAWQKNPLLFGYSGQILIADTNTSLAAGNNTIDSSAVPAGEIWVITNCAIAYSGTVAGVTMSAQLLDAATGYTLYGVLAVTSGLFVDRQGWWVLIPGNKLRLSITGATLNDDGFLRATGFRVDIDQ